MADEPLAEQAQYYRHRAAEYDVTAYGDVDSARERIHELVARLGVTGRVLEIACGTGMWTEALAEWADEVTAIDAAPEAIAIARERVRSERVAFDVVDAFDVADAFSSERRFDVIFFAAWLSHVPTIRLAEFWRRLRPLLSGGGRVLFVDEHVDARDKETYLAGEDEIVERRLQDGRSFRVVKNFVDPEKLERRLLDVGWLCRIVREGDSWVVGEARPATPEGR